MTKVVLNEASTLWDLAGAAQDSRPSNMLPSRIGWAAAVANEVTGKVEESPPRAMAKAVKNTVHEIHRIALTHNESLCDGHLEV